MRSPEDFPADIIAKASDIVRVPDSELYISVARALMERDRAATERAAKLADEVMREKGNMGFQQAHGWSGIRDAIAAAIRSRPMTGFFASLTDEQKKAALAYDGPETHGDAAAIRSQP
jgi:hypothetical protein